MLHIYIIITRLLTEISINFFNLFYRLHKDIVNVINMLKTTEAEEREIQKMVKITKAEEKEVQKEGNEENYCEALILITALVTSCVRY